MSRSRRKRGHRDRVRVRRGTWLIILAMILIGGCFTAGRIRLSQKESVLTAQQKQIETQIDDANEKSKALDQQEAYMKTDDYVRDVAREKFGMVQDGEILFKARDKQ